MKTRLNLWFSDSQTCTLPTTWILSQYSKHFRCSRTRTTKPKQLKDRRVINTVSGSSGWREAPAAARLACWCSPRLSPCLSAAALAMNFRPCRGRSCSFILISNHHRSLPLLTCGGFTLWGIVAYVQFLFNTYLSQEKLNASALIRSKQRPVSTPCLQGTSQEAQTTRPVRDDLCSWW